MLQSSQLTCLCTYDSTSSLIGSDGDGAALSIAASPPFLLFLVLLALLLLTLLLLVGLLLLLLSAVGVLVVIGELMSICEPNLIPLIPGTALGSVSHSSHGGCIIVAHRTNQW
jgi:hypothetical protein